MDLQTLERKLLCQSSRSKTALENVYSLWQELLQLEEDESNWLSQVKSVSHDLKTKIDQVRSTNARCHEVLRALLEDERNLKELRFRALETSLKVDQEKQLWQSKACLKAKCETAKSKLRMEEEFEAMLTKKVKDLGKSVVVLKIAGLKRNSGRPDLSGYLANRLKSKQADLQRLEGQKIRFEKLKDSVCNREQDELSSMASETASEADSEAPSPLSRVLQENIALTLEKKALQDQLQLVRSSTDEKRKRLAEVKAEHERLLEKVKDERFVKEEVCAIEEATKEVDAEIARCEEAIVALQNEVDQNNELGHKTKDEIIQMRTQMQINSKKQVTEEEVQEAKLLKEKLDQKEDNLGILLSKIDAKVKENLRLKEQNKVQQIKLDQKEQQNLEMERLVKERSKNDDDKIEALKRKSKKLRRDVENEKDHIDKLIVENKALDEKIEAHDSKSVVEEIDKFEKELLTIESEVKGAKAQIKEIETSIEQTMRENHGLSEKGIVLGSKLEDLKKEEEELEEQLKKLCVDNEDAKKLFKELEEANLASEKMEKEATFAGFLPWLMSLAKSRDPEEGPK